MVDVYKKNEKSDQYFKEILQGKNPKLKPHQMQEIYASLCSFKVKREMVNSEENYPVESETDSESSSVNYDGDDEFVDSNNETNPQVNTNCGKGINSETNHPSESTIDILKEAMKVLEDIEDMDHTRKVMFIHHLFEQQRSTYSHKSTNNR